MMTDRPWTPRKLAYAVTRLKMARAVWELENPGYDPETACRHGLRFRCGQKSCARCRAIQDQALKFTPSSEKG